MPEEQKDNPAPAASEETPAPSETQPQTGEPPAKVEASEETPPTPKLAGKFDSPEKLVEAYKELESKLGQKAYAETLGERVVVATGYSVTDLQNAGYAPDDIVNAVLAREQGGKETAPNLPSPTQTIKSAVETSKVENLSFELEMERLVRKNPEAEEMGDWIRKMKKHPDYKTLSAKEIYGELQPIMQKGEDAAHAVADEKSRATVSISNAQAPAPSNLSKAKETYQKSGHFADAVGVVSQWLNKKSD